MFENDSPEVTIHKTKLKNKLSIDTERTSTVKLRGQIITVIGHVLISFNHFFSEVDGHIYRCRCFQIFANRNNSKFFTDTITGEYS